MTVSPDEEAERSEVERLVNHHAPGLDHLDVEDLVNDVVQLFRPDTSACPPDEEPPGPEGTYRAGHKNPNNLYLVTPGRADVHVGVVFNGLDGREVVAALESARQGPVSPETREAGVERIALALSGLGITHVPQTTTDPLYDRLAERVHDEVLAPALAASEAQRDAPSADAVAYPLPPVDTTPLGDAVRRLLLNTWATHHHGLPWASVAVAPDYRGPDRRFAHATVLTLAPVVTELVREVAGLHVHTPASSDFRRIGTGVFPRNVCASCGLLDYTGPLHCDTALALAGLLAVDPATLFGPEPDRTP